MLPVAAVFGGGIVISPFTPSAVLEVPQACQILPEEKQNM